MVVLLPNTQLGIRRQVPGPPTRDAHGFPVPAARPAEQAAGPWPGRARETGSGDWVIGLDISAWPVRVNDVVFEPGGREWLVALAEPIRNAADSRVDYIRIRALQRVAGGTEPGGAHFSGVD